MKITINGQTKELSETTNLKALIGQFCKDTLHVIAEVNGDIVRAPHWDRHPVADGDTVELVNIVGGG